MAIIDTVLQVTCICSADVRMRSDVYSCTRAEEQYFTVHTAVRLNTVS